MLTFISLGVGPVSLRVNPRKLEHGLRMISGRIPDTLPEGHEDNDLVSAAGV